MNKINWKAYYRGWRLSRRIKRYVYYLNPYPYQSSQRYAFNSGWENQKVGIF